MISHNQIPTPQSKPNTAITLTNVDVAFKGTTVLKNLSGELQPGTITAVIGGDGAGKSTFLKLLAGRLAPAAGTITNDYGPKDIGYQPAESGVWHNLSVAENLDFCAQVFHLNSAVAKQQTTRLLAQAGLTQAKDRLAAQLSGGMRQKLGVILATVHQPGLVILDEPTTGVDPISRAELWALIASIAEQGAIVVFTTTYLDEAERAQQVFLLDDGELLAAGTPTDVIATIPGTLWRQDWDPTAPKIPNTYNWWRRGNTTYLWDNQATLPVPPSFHQTDFDLENANIALLMSKATKQETALINVSHPTRSHQATEPVPTTLVAAHDLGRTFGTFSALTAVNLKVAPGEIVGLVGGNGAGKTTLMRILLGLEQPTSGKALLMGDKPNVAARAKTGYVAQGLGLYPTLSARENLDFAAAMYGVELPESSKTYAQELGSAPIAALPLGTRRTLAFLTATMHQPLLLIADEPTSGMDAFARVRLWQDLHALADQGTGVLVTTHHMHEAVQCDRLVILTDGKVVAAGTAEEIRGSKQTRTIKTDHHHTVRNLLQENGIVSLFDGHNLRLPLESQDSAQSITELIGPVAPDAKLGLAPATLEEAILQDIA